MPAADTSAKSVARRRGALRWTLLVILLLAIGTVAFRDAGYWLVREDPLGKAEVIVVLSGGMPYRANGAASLFKSGYAPEVWVSRPEGPQQDLAALGIHFVGEEEYNREILVHRGRAGRRGRDFAGRHHQYAAGSERNSAGDAPQRQTHRDYRDFAGAYAARESAVGKTGRGRSALDRARRAR